VRELASLGRDAAVADRDGDAAADGGRRVRHGAHDGGAGRQHPFEEAQRAPRHDREHQRALADMRAQRRYRVRSGLRLHRDDDGGGGLAFWRGLGIELEPAPCQRLHGLGRLRLEHNDLAGREPARQPAVEHGLAHLAGAEQQQRAGEGAQRRGVLCGPVQWAFHAPR
jgi:hypothetical protein